MLLHRVKGTAVGVGRMQVESAFERNDAQAHAGNIKDENIQTMIQCLIDA